MRGGHGVSLFLSSACGSARRPAQAAARSSPPSSSPAAAMLRGRLEWRRAPPPPPPLLRPLPPAAAMLSGQLQWRRAPTPPLLRQWLRSAVRPLLLLLCPMAQAAAPNQPDRRINMDSIVVAPFFASRLQQAYASRLLIVAGHRLHAHLKCFES